MTNVARLRWNANAEPGVLGYYVYVGHHPGVYDEPASPVDVGNVTMYLYQHARPISQWYFSVTAYTTDAESGFSDEVTLDQRQLRAVVAM